MPPTKSHVAATREVNGVSVQPQTPIAVPGEEKEEDSDCDLRRTQRREANANDAREHGVSGLGRARIRAAVPQPQHRDQHRRHDVERAVVLATIPLARADDARVQRRLVVTAMSSTARRSGAGSGRQRCPAPGSPTEIRRAASPAATCCSTWSRSRRAHSPR